jgi:hypothetical protein
LSKKPILSPIFLAKIFQNHNNGPRLERRIPFAHFGRDPSDRAREWDCFFQLFSIFFLLILIFWLSKRVRLIFFILTFFLNRSVTRFPYMVCSLTSSLSSCPHLFLNIKHSFLSSTYITSYCQDTLRTLYAYAPADILRPKLSTVHRTVSPFFAYMGRCILYIGVA